MNNFGILVQDKILVKEKKWWRKAKYEYKDYFVMSCLNVETAVKTIKEDTDLKAFLETLECPKVFIADVTNVPLTIKKEKGDDEDGTKR